MQLPLAAIPALNVNIVIIAVLLTIMLYGLAAGKQRLRILILSIYVGIVLAEQLAGPLAPAQHFLSREQLSYILFAAPIIIFGVVGISHHKKHDKGAFIANALVGLLTGALIVSSALRLMPTSLMAQIDGDSFLATNLGQFHYWILGLLPVVALLFGFMKSDKHGGGH